ncbi:MAG: CotH kinase family protein [Bacteroidetes bacterium]|nr:CotH kinase family protein [Bacteroidota bacterium]
MPKEHDFIFNNFFGDVTYTKDVMSYDMYRRIGRYASRTKYFELFINGDYRGIYCLFEKIKRDKNRVDIAKLKYTDTAGLDVTGGYIFKNDWTDPGDNVFNTPLSSKNYIFHQPDSPHAKQKAYITKFMNRLDSALIVKKNYSDTINGYRAFLDYMSFIDFIALQELSLGGDSYIGSTYFYKDKDTLNNKLNYGPLWDFNYSWNRSFSYPKALRITAINPWREMFKDSFFVKELWCRWINLREDVYSYSSISHYLDSIPAAMSYEIYRDYECWPLSSTSPGQFYGNISNGYHYKTEVNSIKKYLVTRLSDLDSIFYKLASKYSDVCVPTIKVKFDKPAYCLGDSVIATVSGIIKDYIVSVNNKAIYYSPNLIKYKLIDNTPLQVITQVGGSFGYTYFTPKISEKPKINQFINTNLCQGIQI